MKQNYIFKHIHILNFLNIEKLYLLIVIDKKLFVYKECLIRVITRLMKNQVNIIMLNTKVGYLQVDRVLTLSLNLVRISQNSRLIFFL